MPGLYANHHYPLSRKKNEETHMKFTYNFNTMYNVELLCGKGSKHLQPNVNTLDDL